MKFATELPTDSNSTAFIQRWPTALRFRVLPYTGITFLWKTYHIEADTFNWGFRLQLGKYRLDATVSRRQ